MRINYLSVSLLGLVVISIAVVINVYRQAHVYARASAVEIVQPNFDSQASTVGPIRNLRFTLFEAGIRPSQMQIKAGLINILIEDKTNISEGTTIQRVLGTDRAVVGVIQKGKDQSRGRNSVWLTPGEYELYDLSKPANKAVILVNP